MSKYQEKQDNGAFISHYDKEKFDKFMQEVDKTEFPISILHFRELLNLLSQYTYIWYTNSFNPFHLVQKDMFLNEIPPTAYKVYRKESNYMRVLPNIFSHQAVFMINTTGEAILVLAISDEV